MPGIWPSSSTQASRRSLRMRTISRGPDWSPVSPSRAPYWMKWFEHDSSLTLSLAITSTMAAVGPAAIVDVIAKLNVNDESCSNHFIQYGALEGLTGDQSGPREIVRILRERRDACVELLGQIPGISCFTPAATFYLFPNVSGLMARKGYASYDELRRAAEMETGAEADARLHFGRALPGEKDAYVRFAYSGITVPLIEEGLGKLKAWAEA